MSASATTEKVIENGSADVPAGAGAVAATGVQAVKKKNKRKKKKKKAKKWFCPYDTMSVEKPTLKAEASSGSEDMEKLGGSVARKIAARSADFAYRIDFEPRIGRHAVATTDLQPGAVVHKEQAYPWIVDTEHAAQVCHVCAKEFALSPAQPVSCGNCKMASYCSKECSQLAADLHAGECAVLQMIDKLGQEANTNVDLLRIALRMMVLKSGVRQPRRSTDATGDVDSKSEDADSSVFFEPSAQDVAEMISHVEEFDAEQTAQLQLAARSLIEALPEKYRSMDADAVVEFMSKVNANCHGITLTSNPNTTIGLGLYPLSALFNSSCFPNCVFVSEGAKLVFRIIRPVQAGEELCASYIGLYQNRNQRRHELKTTKRFTCMCRRCTWRPTSKNELEHFKQDEFLEGVRCMNADDSSCEGFYRRHMFGTVASVSNDVDDESPVKWVCSKCGHEASDGELLAVESKCAHAYQQALQMYESESATAAAKLKAMRQTLALCEKHLHPRHETVYYSYMPIINCCSSVRDYKAKLDYCRRLVAAADLVLPRNFVPMVNYVVGLAMATEEYAASRRLPKSVLARLRQERLDALRRNVEICEVCLGVDHRFTAAARDRLNEPSPF
eukprot:TRINITY_DN66166_c3_g3_i1.p1 TRINITY_DN66166_c3_g3~~TRINITY_DN66166_c3_g3_i1.p1  ORF type:complete len:633 (+),score=300.19 TRINITY_DN66166_c3_g3_i1:54-1901(+)